MSDGYCYGPERRRRPIESPQVFPTPTAIAERAYELFLADGGKGSSSHEYWLRAEEELLSNAARRATR